MKPAKRAGKKFAVCAALLFSTFLTGLFCVFFLLGSSSGTPLTGAVTVCRDDGSSDVLLLEEQDGKVWMVCGGENSSLLLRLDAGTGRVEAQREIALPLGWAALRNGKLWLREDLTDRAALVSCDLQTLEEDSRRTLDWDPSKLALFDCGPQGAAFCVLAWSRSTLRFSFPDGREGEREFPEEIQLLGVENAGALRVCTDSVFYCSETELDFQELPCLTPLAAILGNGLFLDRDNVVCRLEGASLEPLFQCAAPVFDRLSYCLDGENCLILSTGGGAVSRYSLDGGLIGACLLESRPLAVCAAGGILRQNGALCYVPFSFSAVSPSPSPAPSLPPELPESPVKISEDYLIVPAGFTADQLRELFQPDTVDIRDLMGKQLLHGRLATGMTAGDWVLAVRGDCNGTGTVTQSDLRAALAISLEAFPEEGPEFWAADLNDDGAVDSADLLLFSELLTRK